MKHRRFILISAALLLLTGLIFFLTNFNQPTYKGNTLTSWLRQLDQAEEEPALRSEDSQECRQAISAIGTNGIPTLLNLLRARDDQGIYKVEKIINQLGLPNLRFPTASDKHRWAKWGFIVLGEQAKSAAPDLMQIIQTDPKARSGLEVLYCLQCLKLEDKIIVPFLMETLDNSNRSIANYTAAYLDYRYPAEAEKADVYNKFPWLTRDALNSPATNSPVAHK